MSTMKVFRVFTAGTLLFIFSSCGIDPPASAPKGQGGDPQVRTDENSGVTVLIEPGAIEKGPGAYGVNPLVISPSTRVTWVNKDNIPHSATSSTGSFDSGVISPGQSFSFIFQNAGTFTYYSKLEGESGMSGLIQVGTPPPESVPPLPLPYRDTTPPYPDTTAPPPLKPIPTKPIPKPILKPEIPAPPPPWPGGPPPPNWPGGPTPPPPNWPGGPPPPPPPPNWPGGPTPPPPNWPGGPTPPPPNWPGGPTPPPPNWPGGPTPPPPNWPGGPTPPPNWPDGPTHHDST